MRQWFVRSSLVLLIVGSLTPLGAVTSSAAPTVDGREWRELFQTTGLSWSDVASVCPRDGETPCAGTVGGHNLTGWTWGTADQVQDLIDDHAPGLATADPPVVSGLDGFWGASSFLGVMRWTTYTSLTYFYSEWTGGWTASKDAESGLPISGGAGYSHRLTGTTAEGSIGLGTDADVASSVRGVFLWRPADGDYSPPVVTPTVTGTLGNNGWYRSDVSVSWTVTDEQSPILTRDGCEPSTLSNDSGGTTYDCTATSAGQGGQGSGSVTVKRDATAPSVACGSTPTFELGQTNATVTGSVTDSASGAVTSSISRSVSTVNAGVHSAVLTGTDRAGNEQSKSCDYVVVIPTCFGMTPTILGTGANDVIRATAGIDVVHALGGNDTVYGLGAGDRLCGGEGVDVIKGGGGPDKVDGGEGNDEIFGGPIGDTLDGGLGYDSIRGDDGPDRCTSGEDRMSSCAVLY